MAPLGRRSVQDGYIQQRNGCFKFGKAVDIEERNGTFATAGPSPIYVIGRIKDGGDDLERFAKSRFGDYRIDREGVGREWYRPHPDILFWLVMNRYFPKPEPMFLIRASIEVIKWFVWYFFRV